MIVILVKRSSSESNLVLFDIFFFFRLNKKLLIRQDVRLLGFVYICSYSYFIFPDQMLTKFSRVLCALVSECSTENCQKYVIFVVSLVPISADADT